MDLRSLMNNDAAPARPSSQHGSSQRGSFPAPAPLPQQRSSSGPYVQQQHQHQQPPPPPPQAYYQQRPQHPAYPLDPRASNASLPSTPMALHTPQQQQFPSSQYPFPSQAQQSQHSPSQVYPQITPRQQSQGPGQAYHPHSMSPTPPGAHRSPHVYPPPHSQPSTPLGPPLQPYSRQPSAAQLQHHRNTSGASYALQHQVSIASQSSANSLPPQSAYPSESPQTYAKRPSVDYPTNISERDRSLSVSPKTKVVLPTRQNSTDSSWMARERYASTEPRAAQRSSADQAISPLTTTKQSAKISPSQPRLGSQTPGGLRNILNDDPTQQSPLVVSSPAVARGHSVPHPHLHHSQSSISNGSPVQTFEPRPTIKQEPPPALTADSLLQQPIVPPQPMSHQASHTSQLHNASQSTLKRPAESEPERMDPPKKTKKRYVEPPIWARYAPTNPRYDPKVAQALGPPPNPAQARRPSPRPALQVITPQQPQQAQLQAQPAPQQPPHDHPPQNMVHTNGHAPQNGHDPADVKYIPGFGPWEGSIQGKIAQSNLFVLEIGKYLFEEILSRPDVGVGDARNGALEIEAKLGTLVDRNTNQRFHVPILHPAVLDRRISANLRFESHMTEVS